MTVETADPATLYAATAAAAGALVAIMGGFLISRVIALLAQKEGLELRLRELSARRSIAEQSFERAHADRFAVSAEWFDERHLRKIIATRGNADLDEIVSESNFRGTTYDEMASLAELRNSQVRNAFEAIEGAAPSGRVDDLSKYGLHIPEGQEGIWRDVADAINKRRFPRPPSSLQSALGIVPPRRTISDLPYIRQDQRIRDEEQAAATRSALRAEISIVEDELNRLSVGTPVLFTSIAILAYFAIGSVAFPLVLLCGRTVSDSHWVRLTVVGLFCSGLALLVGFLLHSAWPLRRGKPGVSPATKEPTALPTPTSSSSSASPPS